MATKKLPIEPFPEAGCLAVYVIHEKPTAVGSKHGNPPSGWGVRIGPHNVTLTVFKNSREAKKYAEKHYAIKGWTESSGAPYHQYYAIPEEVKKEEPKAKYRTIDAPWFGGQ